jgi:hypothetical protein
MLASSQQTWNPIASSSATLPSKTRALYHPSPIMIKLRCEVEGEGQKKKKKKKSQPPPGDA